MKKGNEKMTKFACEFNNIRDDSVEADKGSPKVEIKLVPPLSYHMTSERVGPLILEIRIEPDETLGDLFVRLDKENHKNWKRLFNAKTKKMRPPIRTILNDKALSPTVFPQTLLSNGDKIKFVILYGGG